MADTFALEAGGPKRLGVDVTPFSGAVTVTLDGQPLAQLKVKDIQKTPKELPLPDGSVLSVKVRPSLSGYNLELLRNGQPLPGSGTDPKAMVKHGAYMLYAIAAFTAAFTVIGGDGDVVSTAIGVILAAGVYGTLGFFTSRGSVVAASLGLAVYLADVVYTAYETSASGARTGGYIVRIFVILMLARAVQGAWTLRKARAASAPATQPAQPAL